MAVRLLRLCIAAPIVVLLGAATALAAWPDGDVTAREREVVARLTRGGAQRLDADGSHGAPDSFDIGAPASVPAPVASQLVTAARQGLLPPTVLVTLLGMPAPGPRTGLPSTPPMRGRAPPRR